MLLLPFQFFEDLYEKEGIYESTSLIEANFEGDVKRRIDYGQECPFGTDNNMEQQPPYNKGTKNIFSNSLLMELNSGLSKQVTADCRLKQLNTEKIAYKDQ